MTTLTLKNIWKVYDGQVVAVEDVNFTCNEGEFFALLGPSGCGKSSTLRMIAGLEQITAGEMWFDNVLVNDLEPRERNIAMVFETYALYPYLTVYENIAFPLRIRGLGRKEIDEKIQWAAEFLGIAELLPLRVRGLSGGQMQAVGIGRAIVREPSILLMDEPISHLEARQRARMREELVLLQDRLETTTVYVTHDQIEAITMADRIAVMNLGKLQQVGTPQEVYSQPRTEFVGGFIGEPPMNFAACELVRENGVLRVISPSFKLDLSDEMAAVVQKYSGSSQLRLGIRPESISVLPDATETSVQGQVYVLEPQGERTILTVSLAGGERFLVEVSPEFQAQVDQPVHLQFREPLHLFETENGLNLLYLE